ncbi:hypothetical protein [Candidatus Aalborgicola defluviihabitans]|uniref:hypothetical protein n=1 Tax=Candidatus Aalborgicola defluviihabitans TaxID=3386187 RepID=UPI0039B9BC93
MKNDAGPDCHVHRRLVPTGDRAICDADGYLWYLGRSDDMFKSAGYQALSPDEIENCPVWHPAESTPPWCLGSMPSAAHW